MRNVAPILVCLFSVAGCGKPAASPVSVQGKMVFADGKPVKGMVYTFHPDDEVTKSGSAPAGPLPDDGTFSFDCLPGRYRVTLNPIPAGVGTAATGGPGSAPPPAVAAANKPMDQKSMLLSKYTNPVNTPLIVEVPAGGTSEMVLTVK